MSCSPTAPVLGGIVVATVLAVAAILPASADVRIRSSPGGAVEAHLAAFARVRQSGQRVPSSTGLAYPLARWRRARSPAIASASRGGRYSASTPRDGTTSKAVVPRARRRPLVPSPPPIPQGARLDQRARRAPQKVIYLRGKELSALYPRFTRRTASAVSEQGRCPQRGAGGDAAPLPTVHP